MACVCLKIKGRTGIYVVKYLNVCYSLLVYYHHKQKLKLGNLQRLAKGPEYLEAM